MYKAKEDINSYKHGKIKKGDTVPFVEAWLDAGLIEESKSTKPARNQKKETKPHSEG